MTVDSSSPAELISPDTTDPKNVLAHRYSSSDMTAIWSARTAAMIERFIWIEVLKAQVASGVSDATDEQIANYEAAVDNIDFGAIAEREKQIKHDVKARIEIFDEQAGGHGKIHNGLTSRDITETVEQFQALSALRLVQAKVVAAVAKFGKLADEHKGLVMAARTHNQPAQPTTLGKRFSVWGEELIYQHNQLANFAQNYPWRGIKGAVGTQHDLLSVFNQDKEAVLRLEQSLAQKLGFKLISSNVGQVYPRTLDHDLVHRLLQASAPLSNMATSIRLMGGNGLVTEGFSKNQVGSSAMPHKMNTRTSERINGLNRVLKGYEAMAAANSGEQWNEGDVSCSVVRRVYLPDSFYALDGLLESALTVMQDFGAFAGLIEAENNVYGPYLASSSALMAATKLGMNREEAHEIIKEHALATEADRRQNGSNNNLFERLANDDRFLPGDGELNFELSQLEDMTGLAAEQVDAFTRSAAAITAANAEAANYTPGNIL